MAQRHVFHCRLTDFFVSVVRLTNPLLAGQAVLVSDRNPAEAAALVIACSNEAQAYGIKAGMQVAAALLQCPGAIVTGADYDAYMTYSDKVAVLIGSLFPVVEKAAADEYYMEPEAICTAEACRELALLLTQQLCAAFGIGVKVGIAGNKTVASIASSVIAGPDGINYVAGREKQFLAPLPVRKLPCSVSGVHRQLIGKGITHASRLQQMSSTQARKLFGAGGLELWEKANGIDPLPLLPLSDNKALTAVYEEGVITGKAMLQQVAGILVHQLVADLSVAGRLTGTVILTIRDSRSGVQAWPVRMAYTATADVMIAQLRRLIDRKCGDWVSIDQVILEANELVTGSYQIDLFSNAITDLNWHQAMRDAGRRHVYVA